MATLRDEIEKVLMDMIDDGRVIIKGPDGSPMEDLSIDLCTCCHDPLHDDEDESDEDDGDDRE